MISDTLSDGRILLVFGALRDVGPTDAVLIEMAAGRPIVCAVGASAAFSVGPPPRHGAGCPCCVPRGVVADALSRLFLDRARGDVPFFRRVVAVTASESGMAAVRAALAGDQVTAARFRLG